MAKKQPDLTVVLNRMKRGPGRSTLFYWMVENHDRLIESWPGPSIRWAGLCATFEALGLRDVDGKAASVRTAKATWFRVKEAVRKKRAFQMTVARKSSKPIAIPPPSPSSRPQNQSNAGPTTRSSGSETISRPGGPISREAAEAKIMEFRKTLEERSGR